MSEPTLTRCETGSVGFGAFDPSRDIPAPPPLTKWRQSYYARGWAAGQADRRLFPDVFEHDGRVIVKLHHEPMWTLQLLDGKYEPAKGMGPLYFDITRHPYSSSLLSGYKKQLPFALWLVTIGATSINLLFTRDILLGEGIYLCSPPYVDVLCSIQAAQYELDGKPNSYTPLTTFKQARSGVDPVTQSIVGKLDPQGSYTADVARSIGRKYPTLSIAEAYFWVSGFLGRMFLFENAAQLHPVIFDKLVRAFGTEWYGR